MALAFVSPVTVALAVLAVTSLARPGAAHNASEVEALRNLLSTLLAVRLPAGSTLAPAPIQSAPRRLLELLEHLALARRAPWVHGLPTTVRSALPRPLGSNISSLSFVVDIPPDEELVHAKLHLFRAPDAVQALSSGDAAGNELPLATRLRLFHLGQGHRTKRRDLGSVPVAPASALQPDWYTVDVTASVRELPPAPHPHVLGVRFESPRRTVIPASAYLAQLDEESSSSAFLLLLTASRASMQVDTHTIAEALLAAGSHNSRILQHALDSSALDNILMSRRRRSILNNELDEDFGDTIPLPSRRRSYARGKPTRRNKKHEEVCRRRRLDLRFSDLGWQDWILWPETFSAHYCGGQCPFPLTKGMRPTNHASIQSLVRALGLAGVPEPGCVPDQLEPLTLLYRDASGAVVLRSYPNMRVASCACR